MPFFQETPLGIVLTVYVQPRSSRNRIVGLHGDALKMAIQAPPVDDAANRMCIEFLSKTLSLPRSAVEIIGGHTNRTKRILLRFTPGPAFSDQMANCRNFLSSFQKEASISRGRKKTT